MPINWILGHKPQHHNGAITHTCPEPIKRQYQNIVRAHYGAI